VGFARVLVVIARILWRGEGARWARDGVRSCCVGLGFGEWIWDLGAVKGWHLSAMGKCVMIILA